MSYQGLHFREVINRNDRHFMDEWIRMETDVRQLQELKHNLSVHTYTQQHELINRAIEILLAESAERSSQRLEKHTENLTRLAEANDISSKRLLALTWALVFVSIALLVFAVAQTVIMRNEDASTHAPQVQSNQAKPTENSQP